MNTATKTSRIATKTSRIEQASERLRGMLSAGTLPSEQRSYAREALDLVAGSVAGEASEIAAARAWVLCVPTAGKDATNTPAVVSFERRFQGPDNAGLRAQIREAVKTARENGDDVTRAIESVGRRVALTASGQHTLSAVAADYATAQVG
ncbi:MAG: hypothetical protein H0U56_04190 [Methylibium sp.]|nr:hypothetical protein [Methylibium sp.]